MMIKKIAYISVILFCSSLFALGQTGHRVTGAIAEKYLSEETKMAMEALVGNESLAEMVNYPDEMKALKNEKFWSVTSRPYHYVTVPNGKTYSEVGAPEQGDAVYALTMYSKVIRNSSSTKEEKAVALKFIVHIIGDLHQPLHVGNGTDRGGNDFKLKFFYKNSNLHSVWDSGMIKQKELSYTEWTSWLDKNMSEEEKAQWNSTDPLVWIQESYDLRQTIYPEGKKLSYEYLHKHLPILKRRMQQAGVRMAAYLNELFAK